LHGFAACTKEVAGALPLALKITQTGKADATQLTQMVGHALTPDYASPEQIAGSQLTVATDVYSLGVVLFELLTGARPYQLKRGSVAELEEAILAADTAAPSAAVTGERAAKGHTTIQRLQRELTGDLDTIVLKALKKAPPERYVSVSALRDDIARHLAGQPVLARPDSLQYRATKFVRRNRWALSAGSAVFASLVAGLSVALWQADVARTQAAIAKAEAARADGEARETRAIANALVFEIHDSVAPIPGATNARKLVAGKAVEFLDRLAKQPQPDAALLRELVAGYKKVAESQNYAQWANLGDVEGATQSYDKARALAEKLVARTYATDADRDLLADVHLSQARHFRDTGKMMLANQTNALGMARRQAVVDALPTTSATAGDTKAKEKSFEVRRNLAIAQSWRADILYAQGEYLEGIALHTKVLAIFAALKAEDPGSARAKWGALTTHANLGSFFMAVKDDANAQTHVLQALEQNRVLQKDRPDHYSVLHGFGHHHHLLGVIEERAGNHAAAVRYFREALSYRESLAKRDVSDKEAANLVAVTRGALGAALLRAGQMTEAAPLLKAALLAGQEEQRTQQASLKWTSQADAIRTKARIGDAMRALRDPAACDLLGQAASEKAALMHKFPEVKSIELAEVRACEGVATTTK
jgi:eukaryotic-like serine/threonine-protein kinase